MRSGMFYRAWLQDWKEDSEGLMCRVCVCVQSYLSKFQTLFCFEQTTIEDMFVGHVLGEGCTLIPRFMHVN